jgi:diguanylate cyclase (GGDEF)-like protein
LVEVSKTLQKCIRKGDTLSRWGGEEFLFFLPSANIEDAKVLIKRVQKEVDSLYFTCGEVKGIKVTMTFGVAQRDENEKFDDILSRADIALYDGKMAGRDCVVVSEAKV